MEWLKENIKNGKKVIVLEKKEYLQELKKASNWDNDSMICIMLDDIEEFKHLYFLYEFSDRILLISREISNYPTIFNYVDTGILSLEEAMEALLC